MSDISEEIKNCKDCHDESYSDKYAHYVYLDEKKPTWTCFKHPDYYRPWACITNPQWVLNLQCAGVTDDMKGPKDKE